MSRRLTRPCRPSSLCLNLCEVSGDVLRAEQLLSAIEIKSFRADSARLDSVVIGFHDSVDIYATQLMFMH